MLSAAIRTENPQTYFCYLIIKQTFQQWIGFAFILQGLLLLIKSFYQFRKASKIGIINNTVRGIYGTICFWAFSTIFNQLVFMIKFMLSQIIFIKQASEEQSEDAYGFLSVASKYLFVVDITGVFLIQTTLILVCYNW